jgi:hypothetical protein
VTKRADHPGGCAAEHCLQRLVALAKLIDPTYRRRRIAPCRSTRRRDDRQPTFRACLSTCVTRWRSQASTRSAQPRKKGPRASRTCLLRRRYPAPNDGVAVKDLRPLTRSALAGQSLTPTPQPALPKNGGERQKKRSTIRISPSLTSPVPFRDDDAFTRHPYRGTSCSTDRCRGWCCTRASCSPEPTPQRCGWGSGAVA